MSDNIKLIIPGKPEYVGTVRLAVSSIANRAGFDIEAVEDIKVAVSEACTNIVEHGADKDSLYTVSCEVHDDKLIISIEDEAGGYDTNKYKEPDLNAETEGGLGLFIMRALMDEVSVSSEIGSGTKIKMIKYVAEVQ